MSDRHHTKSHHKDFCITMHVLPNVPYLPGQSLKLSVANSEKCRRLDDRHQLHRESLLVEDFLFTLEVGFADYCVQPGRKQWRGVF